MEHSIFYQKRCGGDQGPPLSFLFLESFRAVLEADESVSTSTAIQTAIHQTTGERPSKPEVSAIAERLVQASQLSKEVGGGRHDKQGASLGTALMEWLGALPSASLCHLLARYNPQLSEQLYCEVDYTLVMEMAEVFANREWHKVNASMEACLYGFGGKYEKDKSGDKGNTFDLTKDNPAAWEQLKALGF